MPLAVFLLAGEGNMQGKGMIGDDAASRRSPGTLRETVAQNREEKAKLLDQKDLWVVRDDAWVWVRQGELPAADRVSKGDLAVGYGATPEMIGPEFGFGRVLAEHCGQKVVVIKTAWQDSSLYESFRPPSAVSKRGGTVGPAFTRMIDSYKEAVEELKKEFPGREIQLAGFGWHQGESDRVNELRANEYAANLEDFVHDVRTALGSPKLPVVIATTSMGETWAPSTEAGALALTVENAQLALDGRENISVVYTRPLYHGADQSPANDPVHWNQNGGSLYILGDYLGRRMIDLCPNLGKPIASSSPTPSPPPPVTPPPAATPPARHPTAFSTPPLPVRTSARPTTPRSSASGGPPTAFVYEPFDYPPGPLNGASGGIGFDGPWEGSDITFVAENSIPFGILPTAGNSIGNLSKNQNHFGGSRKISQSALRGRGLLADGATLWVGLILGVQYSDHSNFRLGICLGNNSFNEGKYEFFINDKDSLPGNALGLSLGRLSKDGRSVVGAVVATHFRDKSHGTAVTGNVLGSMDPQPLIPKPGQYRFVVGKFSWGADADTLELYAPGEDLALPAAPISVLTVNVDQSTFDTLSWTRGDSVAFDEIRFGPTYESVCGRDAK